VKSGYREAGDVGEVGRAASRRSRRARRSRRESRPVTAGHGLSREARPVTAAAPLEPAARLRRARGRELRCRVSENGRARRSGRKVKCEKYTRRREFEGGTGRPVRVRNRRAGRRPPPRHTIPYQGLEVEEGGARTHTRG